MRGDFSRDTFDKGKHYCGVLQQQGRVQLDPEWNEQQAIHRYHLETQGQDIIGPSGAPEQDPGFKIGIKKDPRNINLRNPKAILGIGKGRYYVDGILCENDSSIFFDEQKDLPNPGDPLQLMDEDPQGVLVYLDVWRHHITALDDPHIREKALSGPDTTTRIKTVWQLKAISVSEFLEIYEKLIKRLEEENDLEGLPEEQRKRIIENFQKRERDNDKTRTDQITELRKRFDEWKELNSLFRNVKLNAHTKPLEKEMPCYLPPSQRYYGPENQLYRVEVHKGGSIGEATFKWSRENGSVVASIEAKSGKSLTVSDPGKDDVLGFAATQWVEICDDTTDLNESPIQLAKISKVLHEDCSIELENLNQSYVFNKDHHPKLRRWDQSGPKATEEGIIITGEWQPIEMGIEVKFSEGSYKTGDYWLIPARTAIGGIEWPPYDEPDKDPQPQPRIGVYHHYCLLAIIFKQDNEIKAHDCRRIFPSLTSLKGKEPGIHIEDVLIFGQDGKYVRLNNDDEVYLDMFVSGIQIVCDGKIAEGIVSINGLKQPNPICFVTLYIPEAGSWPDNIGYQSIILTSEVKEDENKILWRPKSHESIKRWWDEKKWRRILARLTIKGNFILGKDNSELYLDGDAFVIGEEQKTRLRLPSGDGKSGGDFEMWFWVMPWRTTENKLEIVVPRVVPRGGVQLEGIIRMKDPAPAEGAKIKLSVIDPENQKVLEIPTEIEIPEGEKEIAFVIKVKDVKSTVYPKIVADYGGMDDSIEMEIKNIT